MGFIYKLVSSKELKVYVGKSKQTPKERFDLHKKDYKAWLNGKQHYKSSYELTKHDDCIMTVLEYDIEDNMLPEHEGYWYTQFDCVNKQVPNRTPKEYNHDNKDKIKEKSKEYRIDNRDEILKKAKQYYQNNRDKTKQYYQDNRDHRLEYNKQYRQDNPEYFKQYYQHNQKKISNYKSEKITCECGCMVSRRHMSQHKKTKKHKQIMEFKSHTHPVI